jgi:fermentation-respiration switch protein FrsA (DUF1100 family)
VIKRIVMAVVTAAVSVVGALYFLQERIIFPAPKLVDPPQVDPSFRAVSIATPDGEALAAYFHPPSPGAPTIVLFHGNGSVTAHQDWKGSAYVAAGMGVLLAEYRGYGGSTGAPSEKGLFVDGVAAYDFVRKRSEGPIGLHGHSLGTGVALKVASMREVFGIVLESPFDSVLAVAQKRFPWLPVKLFLKHPFRSDELIANVSAPILILHGGEDAVVLVEHGVSLAERASSTTEFVRIDGAGHNNLAEFGALKLAIDFLQNALSRPSVAG